MQVPVSFLQSVSPALRVQVVEGEGRDDRLLVTADGPAHLTHRQVLPCRVPCAQASPGSHAGG